MVTGGALHILTRGSPAASPSPASCSLPSARIDGDPRVSGFRQRAACLSNIEFGDPSATGGRFANSDTSSLVFIGNLPGCSQIGSLGRSDTENSAWIPQIFGQSPLCRLAARVKHAK